MKWISVKDELPETACDVLFYTKFKLVMYGCCINRNWYEAYNGLLCSTTTEIVTHWMPLPEPPKQD